MYYHTQFPSNKRLSNKLLLSLLIVCIDSMMSARTSTYYYEIYYGLSIEFTRRKKNVC